MSTGIIPADIITTYGGLHDYLNVGQCRTNMAHCGIVDTPQRADAILSRDIIYYDLYTGHALFIECYDLKVVTLKRIPDGAIQGAQMWVQSGTKDESLNFYPVNTAHWGGFPLNPDVQAYVTWSNEPNTVFRVEVPGNGIPWAFHEFYSCPYTVEVWYHQINTRGYWKSTQPGTAMILNPQWVGGGDTTRRCWIYNEAAWASNTSWGFGSGNMETKPDGNSWPVGGNDSVYGSMEARPFHGPQLWVDDCTLPTEWHQYALWPE